MRKLAIIGAARGQKKLCEKAREMGLYTIGFAWEEGAVCKNLFSKFYPISILEKDKIVEICKQENVDGVVSNSSDLTAKIVSYVATTLNLKGNNYDNFVKVQDKFYTRQLTNNIEGLTPLKVKLVNDIDDLFYPCVIKPTVGGGKRGITYLDSKEKAMEAFGYAKAIQDKIMIEEYTDGDEISIESISYNGQHKVIQITDKQNTGALHFVEIGHMQPSHFSEKVQKKLKIVVSKILDAIHYENGASHIEMRIKGDKIYLMEVNLRGGGDEISNSLIELSTNYDYVKAIIDVSLDTFEFPVKIINRNKVAIINLCKQSEEAFNKIKSTKKIIKESYSSDTIIKAATNRDSAARIIYEVDS